MNKSKEFSLSWQRVRYYSFERFGVAGTASGHYFWQDLWAASTVCAAAPRRHVDTGSRFGGFVPAASVVHQIVYVDLRRLDADVPNIQFVQGTLTSLPIGTASIAGLSCLHVTEHVCLGRNGDPVGPDGHVTASEEFVWVLALGGTLFLVTPVGREALNFDAHRAFATATILGLVGELSLSEFSLIDDKTDRVSRDASLASADRCQFCCRPFRPFKRITDGDVQRRK